MDKLKGEEIKDTNDIHDNFYVKCLEKNVNKETTQKYDIVLFEYNIIISGVDILNIDSIKDFIKEKIKENTDKGEYKVHLVAAFHQCQHSYLKKKLKKKKEIKNKKLN